MWSKKISLSIFISIICISIIPAERQCERSSGVPFFELALQDTQAAHLMKAIHDNDEINLNALLRKHGRLENVSFLDTKTFDYIKPIHYAIRNGNKKIIEILLKFGVNIDELSSSKKTPLYFAVMENQDLAFINFLLENGANPLAIDEFNNSLLHAAKASTDLNPKKTMEALLVTREICKKLISKGVNPKQLNKRLENPSKSLPVYSAIVCLREEELKCPICLECQSDANTDCCQQQICKRCVNHMKSHQLNDCPFCRRSNFIATFRTT